MEMYAVRCYGEETNWKDRYLGRKGFVNSVYDAIWYREMRNAKKAARKYRQNINTSVSIQFLEIVAVPAGVKHFD